MPDKKITFKTNSDLANVRLIGLSIHAMANELFQKEDTIKIEICTVEAVNNCIEHAYEYAKEKPIEVKLTISSEHFTIDIIDEGKAMPAGTLDELSTDFDINPNDIEAIPEGNFGLKLIKTNIDDVSYTSSNGQNILTMKQAFRHDNKKMEKNNLLV